MADSRLDDFVRDCRTLFGDDLLSVFLHGSAAGEDFVPGLSDYNLGVVLRSVRPDHLRRAAVKVPRWGRRRISPPLFLDPAFILQSLDVFPIEFTEMKETHRVLYGPDPFTALDVSLANLRHQCESEIRAKLLGLRTGYLRAAGSPKDVRTLALGSLKPVLLVLRNFLRLKGETIPGKLSAVVDRIEACTSLTLAAVRRLIALRSGEGEVKRGEIIPLFEAYLEEVRGIAERLESLAGEESGGGRPSA